MSENLITANHLASQMPLVHFPAGFPVAEWSQWHGAALKSPQSLGEPLEDSSFFGRLKHEHVYLYAGPCCYALKHEVIGDTAAYFGSAADQYLAGKATPFDTGAAEPPDGCLEPYASGSSLKAKGVVEAYSVDTDNWREDFEDWLGHCYDEPFRYISTTSDPGSDGEPDRTKPPAILIHNRGRKGADRRAWTWEVRSTNDMPFSAITLLHVNPSKLQDAIAMGYEVRTTTPGVPGGRSQLYTESESIIQEVFL